MRQYPEVYFRHPDNPSDPIDHEARGWRTGVIVKLVDGTTYELQFYDPVRIRQDAETEIGYAGFFAQQNVVVVHAVTELNIRRAVKSLWESGSYFPSLMPTDKPLR